MADIILGIESSCDDTSAAVLRDGVLLSNVIASQQVHKDFGGVVPELASRAHEQNIVPVVSEALRKAGVKPEDLTAIAFTRGPGLLGSLLVGTSFAKALSLSLDIPMVMVNHLQGHILANFVRQPDKPVDEPSFPYLCLLVSGGNSQIVNRIRNPGPDHRRRGGRSLRQVFQDAGPGLSRRPGHRPPCQTRRSRPLPFREAQHSGPGLQFQRHQDFAPVLRPGRNGEGSGIPGKEQGGPLRQFPENPHRHPDGQAHPGGEGDKDPAEARNAVGKPSSPSSSSRPTMRR